MLVEKVVRGSGLGKSFGFPTANLDISNFDYENNQGVYAGYAILKKYSVAIAILSNPNRFELHFLGLENDEDFYGEQIEVEMIKKVSEIGKFDSVENLVAKISNDVEKVKKILK